MGQVQETGSHAHAETLTLRDKKGEGEDAEKETKNTGSQSRSVTAYCLMVNKQLTMSSYSHYDVHVSKHIY